MIEKGDEVMFRMFVDLVKVKEIWIMTKLKAEKVAHMLHFVNIGR